jgi:hypothetical protein
MSLTDTEIRLAKARTKDYKLADGGGLTLLVQPNGSKWWRLRYRHAGVEKMLSLGVYPDVPLKLARQRRDEARRKLAEKVDPGAERKAERDAKANTLRVLGTEWFELQAKPPENSGRAALTAVTAKKTKWMLEAFLYPKLGTSGSTTSPRPDFMKYSAKLSRAASARPPTAPDRWPVGFFDSPLQRVAPNVT